MQILDLVLSFALLMIAFSTIASGITELLLRLLNARANNLRDAVRSFSEDILLSDDDGVLGLSVPVNDTERKDLLDAICEALTKNPVHNRSVHMVLGWLNLPSTRMIDALSTEAFVQRLAKTTVGTIIAAQSPDERAAILNEITLTFDRYMATSSELFRKYANLTALIVAVLFAGAANIQLGPLVNHLQENPAIVDKIIEQNKQFVDRIEDQSALSEEIGKAIEEVSTQLDALQSHFGLPIGWGRGSPNTSEANALSAVTWLMNVLAAGLLIGLGAPFWYRIVQKVSQIRMIAGTVSGRPDEMVGGSSTSAAGSNDPIARLKTYVDLFEASTKVNRVPAVDDEPAPVG